MSLAQFAFLATAVLTLACLVVFSALVGVRVGRDRAERRRLTVRTPVWRHVLTLSTGEADEVDEARARLLAATPAERGAVEDDAFALVPKLRGDAREQLRNVLSEWGSLGDALRLCHSRSPVRRCRGLHRLGVLRDQASRAEVVAALDDRDFAVRRTAMLALGAFHDEAVVEPLFRRAGLEPRLRREFLSSVDRIGAAAVPVLRAELTEALTHPDGGGRRSQLAAEALGLVGAISAVPELEKALESDVAELQIACSYALGELGASSSVIALTGPLGSAVPDVRRAAARALGLIGGDWAVPALTSVLYDESVEVARSAANALLRCGPAGREVLAGSPAPVAREVVALAALGRG